MRSHRPGLLVATAIFLAVTAATAPSASVQTKLIGTDTVAADRFGRSVAIDGNTLVVGAFNDGQVATRAGSAYVFDRSDGAWEQSAKLVAPDGVAHAEFGVAAALQGDRLVVGAAGDQASVGAAYVFDRTDGTWGEPTKLLGTSAPSTRQGMSVALDGDTIVVGTDQGDYGAGSVFVFRLVESTWALEQHLTASDGAVDDIFGYSVSIDGNTLVAGAMFESEKGDRAGAAYVFTRTGDVWTEQQKLTASDAVAGAEFGRGVAVEADTILVGAPRQVVDMATVGAVYTFERTGSTWNEVQRLVASQVAEEGLFGFTLSMDGERAVVGAFHDDDNAGSAFVFEREEAAWSETARLEAADRASYDFFGISCGVSANTAVFGKIFDDEAGADAGSAYVFEGLDSLGVEVVRGYLLPRRVVVRLPGAGRRNARPGMTVSGTYDEGPDGLDFEAQGTLDVGGRTFPIGPLESLSGGRRRTYDDDDVTLTLRPSRTGTSKGRFRLQVRADLTGSVDPDGVTPLSYTAGERELGMTVLLANGRFTSRQRRGRLTAPALDLARARGRVPGEGRDSMSCTLGFATDGDLPPEPVDLSIAIGDSFSVTIPATDFSRQRGRDVFRGDAGGLSRVIVDWARERITLAGRGMDLGALPQGAVPIQIAVTLGADARRLDLRMMRSGSSLQY